MQCVVTKMVIQIGVKPVKYVIVRFKICSGTLADLTILVC